MALLNGQTPILLCPDILVEIVNHLQPGRRGLQEKTQTRKHRRMCRKTLLACSLACRTLSDLALDVLWRAMDSVEPLLRLLPLIEDSKRRRASTVLKSQITLEAWSRLQSYATRVREIGYSSKSDQVHRSVWTFLGIKCQGSPLLPRLYDLEASEISMDDLSSLFLLLSPSLRSLYLSFKNGSWPPSPQVTLLALQHITQIAPHITTFYMSGDHYFTGDHVSVLQDFSGLINLFVGSDVPFSGPMLLQLSESSSLDTLSVSVNRIHSADLKSLDNGFRSLRKLMIKGSLNHLIKVILSSHLPTLDELVLQVIDSASVSSKRFCRRLALICQHPGLPGSLTRIGCEFYSGISGRRQDTLVGYLDPLLSFPLIEHCRFTFHRTLPSICDADLTRLGDTWTHLQSLEVRHISLPQVHVHEWFGILTGPPPARPADVERPTLFGVIELARRCPSLTRVHLPELDASTRPKTNIVSRLRHSIREISFDDVHYVSPHSEKPCAVAAVLDIAFPELTVVNSPNSMPTSGRTSLTDPPTQPPGWKWRTVMKFVHAMQLGRRHLQLALSVDSRSADGIDFEVSMMGLDDLDLDLGGSTEISEPEYEPDAGFPLGVAMSPVLEPPGFDSDSESSLSAHLSGDSDSDISGDESDM